MDEHVDERPIVENDHAFLVVQPADRILDGLGIDEFGFRQSPFRLDEAGRTEASRYGAPSGSHPHRWP